jgi:hypothetical protein
MTDFGDGRFHIGDILSITTRRLMPPNGMGGVGSVLCFLHQAAIFTVGLPTAAEMARRPDGLPAQIPAIVADSLRHKEWIDKACEEGRMDEVLRLFAAEHGEWITLVPLPCACQISPAEARAVVPKRKSLLS